MLYKKTVHNIELKSEISNVTQNNYKANRAEKQKNYIYKRNIQKYVFHSNTDSLF